MANSFSDLHLEATSSIAFLILSLVSSNLDPFLCVPRSLAWYPQWKINCTRAQWNT